MIGEHIHPNWNLWCWFDILVLVVYGPSAFYFFSQSMYSYVVLYLIIFSMALFALWVELQDDVLQALTEM